MACRQGVWSPALDNSISLLPRSRVIGFGLAGIGDQGLIRPANGRSAIDYEYRILYRSDTLAEIRAGDPCSRFLPGGVGFGTSSRPSWNGRRTLLIRG